MQAFIRSCIITHSTNAVAVNDFLIMHACIVILKASGQVVAYNAVIEIV